MATPIEGQVEIYDHNGTFVNTAAGSFDLEWAPADVVDDDMFKIVRRGNYIVVAFASVEEGARPFWQEMDGCGHIITKEDEQYEFQDALGLDRNDDPRYDEYDDDETKEMAVLQACQQIWSDEVDKPYAVEWDGYSDLGEHYNIAFIDDDVVSRPSQAIVYRKQRNGSYGHAPTDPYLDHVLFNLKSIELPNTEVIAKERWMKARLAGELGEQWAILLRDRSPSMATTHWVVIGPWTSVEPEDLWKYSGVWVPDKDLIEDIESRPEEKDRWARAKELAEQFIDIYNPWANGEVFNVDLFVYEHIAEEDVWQLLVDNGNMFDYDVGGHLCYGYEEAEALLHTDLNSALTQLDVIVSDAKKK